MNLNHVWEKEVVSMGLYLVGTVEDDLVQPVVKHQLYLTNKGRHNTLQDACNVLPQHDLYPELLKKWRARELTPSAREGTYEVAAAQAV